MNSDFILRSIELVYQHMTANGIEKSLVAIIVLIKYSAASGKPFA